MYYDVIEAKHIKDYKLEIVFENGRRGIVDFKDYAKMGGVFSRFSDMEYFKKYYINKNLGVLCWPHEVDIAPETLYHEATGEPLPEWMTVENQKKSLKRTAG